MCVRDHVNAATMISLLMTDFSWLGPGEGVHRSIVQGSMLTMQRNECIKQMEGDWIVFIDDDMVFKPDAIGRLVRSWEEVQAQFEAPVIMGGLCQRRGFPHEPTLYVRETPTSGRYRFLEVFDGIVEVDATGMAFCLIPVRALEAIMGFDFPEKSVRMTQYPPPFFEWTGNTGEDIEFCQKARRAGVRIFVDTDIEIGHIAEVTITTKDFYRVVSNRTDDEVREIQRVNEGMGLLTLSREEARRRLG